MYEISAGELRHQIIIEHKIQVEDKYKNKKDEWVSYCKPYSKVTDMGGKESYSAMGENNKLKTKFGIRYRNDLNTDMRIVFNNRIYNILFVDNLDYKKRWLILIGEADV